MVRDELNMNGHGSALGGNATPAADGHAAMRTAIEFRVEAIEECGAVRVCPIGEIDLATVDQLRARLDEVMARGPERVVLDLRETTFLDSTGVHLIMDAHSRAARTATDFVVISGPSAVRRTFDVAGVTGRLPFVEAPRDTRAPAA